MPVVLGEVAGVGPVDGHAADRVEQHDVVDDGLERRRPRRPLAPASVAGPGRRHERRPAAADLDQLGQDRERDLLGGLGAEVDAGRRAQRGEPLLGEAGLLAQPRAHGGRRASARRRARRTRRRAKRGGERLLVPVPLGRDDDVRRAASGSSRREVGIVRATRSAVGNASGSATGSKTVTRQPAAAPSAASAPAIGVVPATHRTGAGRCGST